MRRSTDGFVPRIREAPSFVAWYLVQRGRDVVLSAEQGDIVDADPAQAAPREPDVLMSASVFETQAQAHASTLLAVERIREELAELLPTPPVITGGEIVAHTAR